MSTPMQPTGSVVVRITLTMDIPVEEILTPDQCFSPDAVIPPELQARINEDQLQELPDTEAAILSRLEMIFSIRDAVHIDNLKALCRGAVTLRAERPQ